MSKKDIKTSKLIKDAIQELDDEYLEQELAEISKEEIDELLDEKFASAILSLSIKNLSVEDTNNIKVTEKSLFKDNTWILPTAFDKKATINFEYKINGDEITSTYADLVRFTKSLSMFAMPNHNDKITSTRTACHIFSYIKMIVRYVFDDNHLLNPTNDLPTITLRQMHEALDRSRDSGILGHYVCLVYGIRHWFKTSAADVIPEQYHFPFAESEIFTDERNKDFIKEQLKMGTFLPYNEDEIEDICDTAYTWIDERSEDLIMLLNHTNNQENIQSRISPEGRKVTRVNITKSSNVGAEIASHNYAVDKETNKPWFTPNFTDDKYVLAMSEINKARKLLVASCISIILLLTGMRIKELQQLKVGCCKETEKDLFVLYYKTFKTAHDAETGEDTNFPVPKILYKAINILTSIYKDRREKLNSDYLIVPENKGNNKYAYASTGSLRRILRCINEDISVRPHRFRKTIAWLLISRSEKNIDIIRQLFGHHSYKMTLKYILRNYELVEEVVNQLRVHYAEEFYELTTDIISGHYSGPAAERIAESINSQPEQFSAQMLRTTLNEYVTALLESGEPIFIHRVPVGSWCLSVPVIGGKATPCTAELDAGNRVSPDATLCKYEDCDKFAGTPAAIDGIIRNVKFYESVLSKKGISEKIRKKYEHKIKRNNQHLKAIQKSRPITVHVAVTKD